MKMPIAFTRYTSIGLLNTAVHWTVFGIVYTFIPEQSLSNLAGFLVAVTCSFYLNARWTFSAQMTIPRYLTMVAFMASLSWSTGKVADLIHIPAIATLMTFSMISLVVGFLFTKHFVFKSIRLPL